ncbi:MAG: hypothetical protein QOE90_921 [Thermoplasmata archaeon]|jgi:drug/metabolite transporter (DMT)-like permease|nr:hypothetical protein [Thermoplasmata archaeon]
MVTVQSALCWSAMALVSAGVAVIIQAIYGHLPPVAPGAVLLLAAGAIAAGYGLVRQAHCLNLQMPGGKDG